MSERSKIKAAMRKVAPLGEQLERRFDLKLTFESAEHAANVKTLYSEKREMLLRKHGIAESVCRDDYVKSVLISEAATLFLREIAPTRLKKRNRRKDNHE